MLACPTEELCTTLCQENGWPLTIIKKPTAAMVNAALSNKHWNMYSYHGESPEFAMGIAELGLCDVYKNLKIQTDEASLVLVEKNGLAGLQCIRGSTWCDGIWRIVVANNWKILETVGNRPVPTSIF